MYLVGLVVVLGVVLEHGLLLGILPCGDGIIELDLFPPLLAVDEHLLGEVDIELAGAEEAQQGQGVEALGEALGLQHAPKLVDLGLLHGRQIASMSVLLDRCLERVVVVVILGVDLEGSSVGHVCGSAT